MMDILKTDGFCQIDETGEVILDDFMNQYQVSLDDALGWLNFLTYNGSQRGGYAMRIEEITPTKVLLWYDFQRASTGNDDTSPQGTHQYFHFTLVEGKEFYFGRLVFQATCIAQSLPSHCSAKVLQYLAEAHLDKFAPQSVAN